MQAVCPQCAINFSELSSYPGLSTSVQSRAAEGVAGFCGSQAYGTVAFGSEGGLFDQAGIPPLVCGPGSMDQGHKPDEFISVAQPEPCDRMLERVLVIASRHS